MNFQIKFGIVKDGLLLGNLETAKLYFFDVLSHFLDDKLSIFLVRKKTSRASLSINSQSQICECLRLIFNVVLVTIFEMNKSVPIRMAKIGYSESYKIPTVNSPTESGEKKRKIYVFRFLVVSQISYVGHYGTECILIFPRKVLIGIN